MSKPKTHWNYRLIRRKFKGEVQYAVHEVFYKDDAVWGWTSNMVGPAGGTIEELLDVIAMMREATEKPVLDYKTGKEIE